METINSLLPVCDEILVCDSDSADGTWEMLCAWQRNEPKLRLTHWTWPHPFNNKQWLLQWIDWTRQQLRYEMQIELDADEVLHEDAYPEILRACAAGECRWFQRHNFWGDTRYLAPSGYVCGDSVARLGPSHLLMPSDEPRPEGEPEIRVRGTRHPSLCIFHYGFIRRKAAFYEKSKVVQTAFNGSMDDRLHHCEKSGEDWTQYAAPPKPLIPFHGNQPRVAHDWLLERGHQILT